MWIVVLVFSNLMPSISCANEFAAEDVTPLVQRSKLSLINGEQRQKHSKRQNKRHSKKQSKKSCSCDKQKKVLVEAPPYIRFVGGVPELQVAVLNRTSLVSPCLLEETLAAITEQVNRDFAPYYGIRVNLQVFENEFCIDWNKYTPLVIPDLVLDGEDIQGTYGFHNIQDSSGINGAPISDSIANAPPIPNGTPYQIVPMGTAESGYGVFWNFLQRNPTDVPTFEGVFSTTMSHEVLEALGNYTIGKYFNAVDPETNNYQWYIAEVCDPVQDLSYVIRGIFVSDFVLPSYWIITEARGPFSFLNTVPAALTPYSGVQNYVESSDCGTFNFTKTSESPLTGGNPLDVTIEETGTIFSCDDCVQQVAVNARR